MSLGGSRWPPQIVIRYPRLGAASISDDDLEHYRTAAVSGERLGPKVTLDPEGEELLARIKHSFAHWQPNAGLTWVQGEMLDNRETAELLRAGADIGVYESWQEVPPELLAAFPSAAWFLDDAALNFYWPALMVWELQYGPTFDWATPAEKLSEWSERLHRQTDEQSQVFTAYMQYISRRSGCSSLGGQRRG